MAAPSDRHYWNHNTAYHPWLVGIAAEHRGEIAVVGCCANKTVRDWVWSAMCVPAARIGSWLHSESRNIGVKVQDPKEGLDDIRRTVDEVLPGASLRRALYCRYLLRWTTR